METGLVSHGRKGGEKGGGRGFRKGFRGVEVASKMLWANVLIVGLEDCVLSGKSFYLVISGGRRSAPGIII